jgi:hypothetical protein
MSSFDLRFVEVNMAWLRRAYDCAILFNVNTVDIFGQIHRADIGLGGGSPNVEANFSTLVSGTSDEGVSDISATRCSPAISSKKESDFQLAKAGLKIAKMFEASFEGGAGSSSNKCKQQKACQ